MRVRRIVAATFRTTLFTVLAVLTLGGLGLAGARVTAAQGHLEHTPYDPASAGDADMDLLPTGAGARPARPKTFVVAVILGTSATVATDAMGPYEVFARSPRFSVYTVARDPGPAPTQGAPSIVPDHTFSDVDAHAELAPDVVVVPAVDDPSGIVEQDTRDWVAQQHARGARILSVCAGAMLMAETGLLDGRTATSHWSRLSSLRAAHPETRWVAGQRFVRDGTITTTAGITSGIPGALSVIEDLAGADEAGTVGAQVGYPGWSPDAPTAIPVQSWALADWPFGLNTLLPWGRPTIGIQLQDGDGEIDTAALFEVYANSAAARTVALNDTGVVHTAHGMTLLTLTEPDAPSVDIRLRPGVHGPSGRAGFDGALEYLADVSGATTARSAAKMIDYPVSSLNLGTKATSARTPVLAATAVLLAIGVG
ncbi:DJ-1/PfpI family protein, partial [Nocardioides zeicaulis]